MFLLCHYAGLVQQGSLDLQTWLHDLMCMQVHLCGHKCLRLFKHTVWVRLLDVCGLHTT